MGEERVLPVTKLVNFLFAKPALALFALLHLQPADAQYPIPNFFAMELVVFLFAIVFFLWLRARMSVEIPGATQQCMEFFLSNPMGVGVKDLLDDIVGHGSEQFLPIVGSIGLFILFCNLAGVIPGSMSPTAEKTVPLGCAVVVFLYYHWQGLRHHGAAKYVSTFMGPKDLGFPWPVTMIFKGLMLIIETISHCARLLSLTVRLWANMFVGELVYVVFLGLTVALMQYAGHLNAVGYVMGILPVGFPLILIVLHVFESILQAFIFTILPIIYLAFAVAEEH
ncbi:MAG: F0F1 ATP synthase subunit A [Candidatus Acidiferrales bacterium]